MRLTEELPMGSYRAKTIYLEPNRNEQECVYKLGQLEDIEDELGIDLITLFKVLKCKVIFIPFIYDNDNNLLDTISVKVIGINKNSIIYENEGGCYMEKLLQNYGKTWALTKKELL